MYGTEENAQVSQDGRKARILIADDNPDMRKFLVQLLSQTHEVVAVGDGLAALNYALEQVPDLVLSDVTMPGLDGLSLLKRLRDDPKTRGISIVLVSARTGVDSRIEGLDVGADDYLEKPFTSRELMARVNANLRLARMRKEIAEHEKRTYVAEAANEAKSKFLTTMSHELRTPLNAITGYVELLEMGLYGSVTQEQQKALERIRHSGQYLLSLITDILNFSQLHANQLEFHLRDVCVHDILESLGELVEPQAQVKGIAYSYIPCNRDIIVYTDPDRLTQIILNLLVNAVKFTGKGGRVTVQCSQVANEAVHILVTDTGSGIPADKISLVFEPFVQLERHLNNESQQGVGLGLAIGRDLARNLSGDITVESTEGKGTTFCLSLPIMASSTSNREFPT